MLKSDHEQSSQMMRRFWFYFRIFHEPMNISENLRVWAKRIKRDSVTLWFAGKHPDTPWYAKALGVFVVAYALSPIDLIPDFIPVLGYVDDILLLPALIWLTIKLLPASVLDECRIQADAWMAKKGTRPSSRVGAIIIIMLWIAIGLAAWFWLLQTETPSLQKGVHYESEYCCSFNARACLFSVRFSG